MQGNKNHREQNIKANRSMKTCPHKECICPAWHLFSKISEQYTLPLECLGSI